MKRKIIITSIVLSLFLISFVSAMEVRFFYSETCPYCKQIHPFVMEKVNEYPTYIWGIYETSNQENYNSYKEYGFTVVPAFVINTDDGREIKFTGANPIKLNCELQEMSTKDCPTYSADSCIGKSWFK